MNHYLVSMQGVHWQVSNRGSVMGPFSTKEEAMAAAVDAARNDQSGDPPQVLVENEEREFELAWSHDKSAS